MRKLSKLAIAALTLVASISYAAVPDLYIDGVIVDPSANRQSGREGDLLIDIQSGQQQWTLLNKERNSSIKSFGIYEGSDNREVIFNSSSSVNDIVTTNVTSNTDVGFWLMNDHSVSTVLDESNISLYSNRYLNQEEIYRNNQSFMVYDLRNAGGGDYSFGNWHGNGSYDYLIFVENGRGNKDDHKDMVIGLMANPVPEPGTLMLLGSGLIGTGLMMKRRKK